MNFSYNSEMNKENKIIDKNLLYLIPVIFIIIIIFRITYIYDDTKVKEYQFAKKEAEVLNSYVLTHRNYYQKFFINKDIVLNKKTIHALPAYSAAPINETFTKNNPLNIKVKTVSDRARNPKNMVDSVELKVVNYFKKNKNEKEYFSGENKDFYQYGYALRIEKKCLTCHGKKENAPEFIRNRYTNAYDYKLGEVRGIISIKVPKENLNKYFYENFINSIIYDILLFIALAWFIFYLIKKLNNINKVLEEKIKNKTKELSDQNAFLNSYVQALDNSSALTKSNTDGIITYANDKFLKDTGYIKEEVIGKTHKIIKHPDTPKEIFVDMWETVLAKKTWNGIVKGLRKDKTLFVSKMSIVPVCDNNGDIIEYISPRTDITELILNKEKIKKSFITDNLTSLPNRQKLIDDIKCFEDYKYHLALINIDRFKEINDFYGHSVADKILILIANKFKSVCNNDLNKIYKLPSDEYAILTSMDISAENFYDHMKIILKEIMATKFKVDDNNIFISMSCGIASNTNSIMVKADMALQSAKSKKEHIIAFDDSLDMSKKINENIEGVALLKEAIDDNNIIPYFQPIFNIHTKKIEKYECLARITQKNGFIIAPFKFLEIAIKSKLYPHITKNIIMKSFEFFKDKDYEFSINLSIEDIINKNTAKFIFDSLKEFPNPTRVVFEILETEKIDNYDELKEFISLVKEYGCQIAIDDFGSGYSNFAHILELNIDYLKIDSSLVKYVSTDENSKKITQTIINFAKELNMKTIAEFVEDKKSLDLLEKMGVDYIQGYYIGKPQNGLNNEY